jgi:tRNA U34 5-methylaminomethyl-2-thiouridine-forming methyltransferase MnmC
MERILLPTADGSLTISIPDQDLTYHSTHGAIQESMHVFIGAGLKPLLNAGLKQIDILEMGYGTGLNALLTYIAGANHTIRFETIEAHPLEIQLVKQINYCEQLNRPDLQETFLEMHKSPWEKEIVLQPGFTFIKQPINLVDYTPGHQFDLIYFDAFSPVKQPELWTLKIFSKLYTCLKANGILVTYCSKTVVRKAMSAAGLVVEKIPGPRGKREIVRAKKPSGL